MKVYVLTMTSQLGQGDQQSSTVLGVYESRERAVQAHHAAVVDEMAEYVENYDEVATRDTYLGTLITRPSDDSYWTFIQQHESEML